MSAPRVLVICASKGGSTREIGDAIALTLREEGLDTDVRLTAEVVDLAPYRAVIVGSAVYMMRWRSAAVRFLKKHRRELAERDVWLFQSGPLDRSAEETQIPLPKSVATLAARIHAHTHATFGGRLGPGAEGFIAKKMVENGHGGDFRNFEQIRLWAKGVARELGARAVA
jgi:menaquinone-dependent protoporphyrinogen oxidase